MPEDQEEATTINFRASFPATQTAIQRHGAGEGMRIVLDIPESEMSRAIPMLAWTQRELKITMRALKPKITASGGVSDWED